MAYCNALLLFNKNYNKFNKMKYYLPELPIKNGQKKTALRAVFKNF